MQTTLTIHIDHTENYYQVVWKPRGSKNRFCLAEGHIDKKAVAPTKWQKDPQYLLQSTDISRVIHLALNGELPVNESFLTRDEKDVKRGPTIEYEMGAGASYGY